jgi:spoIIIJ-associated protein
MRMVEKEGKTKAEALKLALAELNAKKEDVKIEVLDEGKNSFLGLGQHRPARLRVFFVGEEGDESVVFIKQVCAKMGIECRISIAEEDDKKIVLCIDSKDSGILIGKRGKNLEALQYLTNVVYNIKKTNAKKIILDVEGYREKRKETLVKLAQNLAQKVRATRKPQVLEEMNPYERRIIHMTLEEEKDIETSSIGSNNMTMKRVRISLKNFSSGPRRAGKDEKVQ